MLLQAVLERYGDKLVGVTPDAMVKEFLGPAPAGADKIKGGEGSFSKRGALELDTQMTDNGVESMDLSENTANPASSQQSQIQEFMERTKYIPIRLTLPERKLLRLCEAALNVRS